MEYYDKEKNIDKREIDWNPYVLENRENANMLLSLYYVKSVYVENTKKSRYAHDNRKYMYENSKHRKNRKDNTNVAEHKNDMTLTILNYAISYYYDVYLYPRTNWELPIEEYNAPIILPESIDYEAFPELLGYINKQCNHGLSETEIKNTIWNCESGTNLRKKYSVFLSSTCKKSNVWELIKYSIHEFQCSKVNNSFLYYEKYA